MNIVNTPDVEAALRYQKLQNAWPNRWARFYADYTYDRVVIVQVGYILSDGTKERVIETAYFGVDKDGNPTMYKHPNV